MALPVQTIFDRALLLAVADDAGRFGNSVPEILARVNYAQQQRLFTRVDRENRHPSSGPACF